MPSHDIERVSTSGSFVPGSHKNTDPGIIRQQNRLTRELAATLHRDGKEGVPRRASTLASDDALAATLVIASDERWEDIVE